MKAIATKMAAVMATIRHPERSAHVTFGDFHYATRDDIFECTREALTANGVAWIPSMRCTSTEPTGKKTKGGDEICRVSVDVEITFIDTETGESIQSTWSGQALTHDERGAQGASTQAVRFALTNTFMLLDGFDMDTPSDPATPNHEVTREKSSVADPARELVKRLYTLDFSETQNRQFGQFIAKTEGVEAIRDVPAPRMLLWFNRLDSKSDDEARQSVMDILDKMETA